MEKLEVLNLSSNKIGDEGMVALAGSIGAMEKLVAIWVDDEFVNHPQLKAACSERGVALF